MSILEQLDERGVATGDGGIQVEVKKTGTSFGSTLLAFLPLIIFGGLILYMMRRARGGINQITSLGKSQARLSVGGGDEALSLPFTPAMLANVVLSGTVLVASFHLHQGNLSQK